jgi:hypothetical protein
MNMFKRALSSWPWLPGIAATLGVGLVINGALWLLAVTQFPHGDTPAVLHYNIDTGIDLIGESKQIIMLPAVGLGLLLGNSLLGAVLRRSDLAAAWIMWSVVPILQLILLGSFILIWQANR